MHFKLAGEFSGAVGSNGVHCYLDGDSSLRVIVTKKRVLSNGHVLTLMNMRRHLILSMIVRLIES